MSTGKSHNKKLSRNQHIILNVINTEFICIITEELNG